MWVNTKHSANALLLRTYASNPAPIIALPDSIADPYTRCGCHPDVVQRVWDQLGAALPREARCLFYETPALVLPLSGVVAAIGFGTQYCLRIPTGLLAEALAAGAMTIQRWSTGGQTDIQSLFGPDWVFGSYADKEREWCKLVAELYEPPSLDASVE